MYIYMYIYVYICIYIPSFGKSVFSYWCVCQLMYNLEMACFRKWCASVNGVRRGGRCAIN